MREKRPGQFVPGEIVDRTGKVLGRHDGISFYTIGQRRGLGIAASEPLYVTALDAAQNRVVVGTAKEVFARELTASDLSRTMRDVFDVERTVHAKIRYGKREAQAVMTPLAEGRLQVRFTEPQRAVTPGQSIVFYEGDVVLGGGIIDAVIE